MSRIGLKVINLPEGVSVRFDNRVLNVSGPKGNLSQEVKEGIDFKISDKLVNVVCSGNSNDKSLKALHGLYRSLANNMVIGVTQGYSKKLKIVGVGYKVQMKGRNLNLSMGYSHAIDYLLPDNVECKLEDNVTIFLSSFDKQLLGHVAASIRSIRPPEPYKQKGIRYIDEVVKKKAGKAAKSK